MYRRSREIVSSSEVEYSKFKEVKGKVHPRTGHKDPEGE
jgi:hypothetical protein